MVYCSYRIGDGYSELYNHNLVFITGRICSGKTLACKFIENEFGYIHIPCSLIMLNLLDLAQNENLERRVIQDSGYNLISQKEGNEKFAFEIYKFISNYSDGKVALDGLRSLNTLRPLEAHIQERFTIIHIGNRTKDLFSRYKEKYKNYISYYDFSKMLNHPVELEINKFKPRIDFLVYNCDNLEAFYNIIERLFKNEFK